MYYNPYGYPYQNPYYYNGPMYDYSETSNYWNYPIEALHSNQFNSYQATNGNQVSNRNNTMMLKDYGPNPFVINIHGAAKQNNTYRTALWTGPHLQVTLMSLNPGEDIGLEIHPDIDQFLRIEQGQGITQMGKRKDQLNFRRNVNEDSAIFVPAGTWHNLTNTGNVPLKLYSIYAPPKHPFGTVHPTKADAMAGEHGNGHGSGKTSYEWHGLHNFL